MNKKRGRPPKPEPEKGRSRSIRLLPRQFEKIERDYGKVQDWIRARYWEEYESDETSLMDESPKNSLQNEFQASLDDF